MTLFIQSKLSDQLFVVEEEDKPVMVLSHQELVKKLDDGKFKDGTLCTKVTILEKSIIVTRKELQKINGE